MTYPFSAFTRESRRRAGMSRRHLAVIAITFFFTPVSTALAQAVFTPHNVARVRTVTAAAIAPDGSQVAYVLNVPRVTLQDDDARHGKSCTW